MLRALGRAGAAGIAQDIRLLTMQQLVDLGHVRHIGRRASQVAASPPV